MIRLLGAFGLVLALAAPGAAQVLVFENNGLKYQALTRAGVTIMYAHLPQHIHEYTILQMAVSNGSGGPYTIRPDDCSYLRDTGVIRAVPAATVIQMLMKKGNGSDVIKLVTAYESWISGLPNYRPTNGFEQRRQSALAMGASRMRSAAAASAIALVQTELQKGESTDGAVFFPSEGKYLFGGRLVVKTNTDLFEFNPE